MLELLTQHPWLLALAVFLARVLDVSLGTVRMIFVFRGHRLLASAVGFVETMIWLAAAGQVLKNLDAWYLAVAFAAGFACGNAVGIWLEGKLALGWEMVRAVSPRPETELAEQLQREGYDVIEIQASRHDEQQRQAPVEVLLLVERRRKVPALLERIQAIDPEAMWTINDVKPPLATGRPRRLLRK